MSTTAAALRAPRRAPRPIPVWQPRRAPLRVVDVAAQRRARRVRRLLWCFAATIVGSLIAAVGFHVFVAQGQLEIDHLEREVGELQHRYEQLRLEVATLASPERIVTRAGELCMVASTEPPITMEVPGDPAATAPPPSDSTATTLAESWPKVKQHLDAQP